MEITFQKVIYRHKAKDANGKMKQKTFFQTLNPFNVKNDGSPKNRNEIFLELKQEASDWEKSIKGNPYIS